MRCQILIIPMIIILLVLLFDYTNLRILKEPFLGCPIAPNTPKIDYKGPLDNFNIDNMCKEEQKKYLTWPCFWRKHYNKSLPDNIGGEELYNNMKNVGYHQPFKYDGVYDLQNCK